MSTHNTSLTTNGTLCTQDTWKACLTSKWADIALIVGAISCLSIAITATMGCFCGIGISQANHLSYAMYSLSGVLILGLVIKLTCAYLGPQSKKSG